MRGRAPAEVYDTSSQKVKRDADELAGDCRERRGRTAPGKSCLNRTSPVRYHISTRALVAECSASNSGVNGIALRIWNSDLDDMCPWIPA